MINLSYLRIIGFQCSRFTDKHFYRPYVCDKCGMGFYRNNILKDHMLRGDAQQASPATDKPSEILKTEASSSEQTKGQSDNHLRDQNLLLESSSQQ